MDERKQQFAVLFDKLLLIFPKEMEEEEVGIYYASLSGYSIDSIARGVGWLIKNHDNYFPKPARMIEAINKSFQTEEYNNNQIEFKNEIPDDEIRYRMIFASYYAHLINTRSRGYLGGFKLFIKTLRFKRNHKNISEKDAIALVDKYCDPSIFDWEKIK